MPATKDIVFNAEPVPINYGCVLVAGREDCRLVSFNFVLNRGRGFARYKRIPRNYVFGSIEFGYANFVNSNDFNNENTSDSLNILSTYGNFCCGVNVFFTIRNVVRSLIAAAMIFRTT